MSWYKGNLHCHSTNSDGKQPPDEVARYYRAIGMDFVAADVEVTVKPEADQSTWSAREIVQDGIDRTRTAAGVPVVCHPCWNRALDAETMPSV